MRRGWLVVALLLSLGVNLGLVGTAIARRRAVERWWNADRERGIHRPLRGDEEGDARPAGIDRFAERPAERMADRLRLDPSRREKFLEIQRRTMAQTIEARREIGRIRAELRRAIVEPEPDRAAIDALVAELGAAENAVNRAFVDGILETTSELGPEERGEYLRMLAELGVGRGLDASRGGPAGPPMRGRRFLPGGRPGDREPAGGEPPAPQP